MSLKENIVRQFGKPTGFFGRIAGYLMSRRSSNRMRNRATVELMQLTPQSRVLEIGCGPGLALSHCASIVSEGRIVGLDHSAVMIGQCSRRLASQRALDRVELVLGNMEPGLWHECFDRAYSLNVIQFIADKPAFFKQVFEVLAPDGICFTTYQPRMDNRRPDAADQMADTIEASLREAGFIDIVRSDLAAGDTPAICVRGKRPE